MLSPWLCEWIARSTSKTKYSRTPNKPPIFSTVSPARSCANGSRASATRTRDDTRCNSVNQSHDPSISMDPAQQLQRLYVAGFDLQVFDRFPKCVGVVRDNCIALLVPSQD